MPSSMVETMNRSTRRIIPYLAAAAIIILAIYYLPNYSFLEKATADSTSLVLGSLGIRLQTTVVGGSVFLGDVEIVKDCTGVQVVAVFFGLLIPIPDASLKRKALTLAVVSGSLYTANVLRVTLELLLVRFGVLPWSLAHYPLSLLLGVLGVFVLVLVTDRLMPEFSEFLLGLSRPHAPRL